MATIILPPTSTPANPSEGEIYYDNTSKQVKVKDDSSFKALADVNEGVHPHIITKKLHPAYLGKLLDDTTSHSGVYGTAQSDGRMYYYTDIAGSKPIKDPRIGVHLGSQRYKFRSIQLLEQETATHAKNVYSLDGREYMRVVDASNKVILLNGNHGNFLQLADSPAGCFIEVVGYFNNLNLILVTDTNRCTEVDISIDGVVVVDGSTTLGGDTTASSPLMSRYVDAGSIFNTGLTSSLGIHTAKIECKASGHFMISGIELIAQDTTSSSTKPKIQIPAQDVVSYGRRFSVSATAQHYDPFNGFSSGNLAAVQALIDKDTSLGCDKWLNSSTYYRPYNGMRVVKWVDSNGAIKTSVTAMPPNAKSLKDADVTKKANASVANDTYLPTFEAHTTSVGEDNLHEVAKTFYIREFGNGAANGGTGATWADASMLSSNDDWAYCMDDGLTSGAGDDNSQASDPVNSVGTVTNGDSTWYTWIGTGISLHCQIVAGSVRQTVAMNLPYGTHILKIAMVSGGNVPEFTIDGVALGQLGATTYGMYTEITFYQPKKPPIPEDAVVLADYMQFADFKPQTASGVQYISKGTRRVNCSRDIFYDETDGDSITFSLVASEASGFEVALSGNADSTTSFGMRLPSFGTNYVVRGYQNEARHNLYMGSALSATDKDSASTKDNTAGHGSYSHLTSDETLGVFVFGTNAVSGTNGHFEGFDIATPIHTSHHYQPFETPFLHELIGGDRSMEQTNLIVTSDGKTWDEVTRDASYLGNNCVFASPDATSTNGSAAIFDDCRGLASGSHHFNKDFAIGYDRFICLKNDFYRITILGFGDSGNTYASIKINGTVVTSVKNDTTNNAIQTDWVGQISRGDYVQSFSDHEIAISPAWMHIFITRV